MSQLFKFIDIYKKLYDSLDESFKKMYIQTKPLHGYFKDNWDDSLAFVENKLNELEKAEDEQEDGLTIKQCIEMSACYFMYAFLFRIDDES